MSSQQQNVREGEDVEMTVFVSDGPSGEEGEDSRVEPLLSEFPSQTRQTQQQVQTAAPVPTNNAQPQPQGGNQQAPKKRLNRRQCQLLSVAPAQPVALVSAFEPYKSPETNIQYFGVEALSMKLGEEVKKVSDQPPEGTQCCYVSTKNGVRCPDTKNGRKLFVRAHLEGNILYWHCRKHAHQKRRNAQNKINSSLKQLNELQTMEENHAAQLYNGFVGTAEAVYTAATTSTTAAQVKEDVADIKQITTKFTSLFNPAGLGPNNNRNV